MTYRLTVGSAQGAVRMVSVGAGAGTTVGELAEQLFRADPSRGGAASPADATLVVTARSLGPEAVSRPLARDLDLASSGLRSGDHVEIVPAAHASRDEGEPPAATATIVEGPGKGRTYALRAGSNVIGRDADVSVRLDDPLASKRHARLVVGDALEIVDMGSTNGVLVDGTFVTRAPLVSGDRIVIGDTHLEIARAARAPQQTTTDSTVSFTRSPRVVPALPEEEIAIPDPPVAPQTRPFPRIALVAPVVLGLSMYMITGRLISLIFVAMSPLMIIGGFWDNRFNQRKQREASLVEFDGALESAERQIGAAQDRERAVRLAQSPSVAEVADAVRELGPLLWTRRTEHDGFLTVRMGLGAVPSVVDIQMPSLRDAIEDTWERAEALRNAHVRLTGAPVVASLRAAGGLGIIGPEHAASAAARGALVQLAGLHSPMDCVIAGFVAPGTGRWRWLEWLPHTASPVSPLGGDHVVETAAGAHVLLTSLEQLVASRAGTDIGAYIPTPRGAERPRDDEADQPTTPAVIVLVEEGSRTDRRRLVRLAEKGADVNVHVLWVTPDARSLPAACRSFVEAPADGVGTVGHVRRGSTDEPVVLESMSLDEATELARRLACVEDAGVVVDDAGDVPPSVSYLDLHGFEALEPAHHEQRWRADAPQPGKRRPFTLRALVGHAGSEPCYLDLKEQGPHALVGGTTGAGKSEFLQSWILGMAAAYSPERVTFLFVDYKGGSAFADCVRLPHSVGLVTDLTPHLVDRALASLRAELHHRERLLAAKGAKDLETLDRAGDPETPPSLVIVIDEFATLVQEVPAFVDGVVDIAQRGRSLGLHLIMATQRPAGVIKDNLRANTNLRIALRMADEADSSDILGVTAAAHVDPSLPGRAMARTGPGRLMTFQSAYVGAHSAPGAGPAPVAIRELALGAGDRWELPEGSRPAAPEGDPDAARVVEALVCASVRMSLPAPRRPWLDELPATVDLRSLSNGHDGSAVFALVDDPAHQAQHPAEYDPDQDGTVLVLGGSGAGKSTALRSLALGATFSRELSPVHIYGLDAASGGLEMLRSLPHVADVVDADDLERVGRMLSRLVQVVRERQASFTAARASSVADYRTLTDDRALPRLLLLIDGYGRFQADYMHEVGRSQVWSDLQEVLADGRAVGVHAVLSADRVGALHTSIQAMVSRTIVLRMNDENQYGMLGLRRVGLGPDSPAGRGIDVSTRRELQIAVLGASGRIDRQARAIEELAARVPDRPEWRAAPIPRMPVIVHASEMPSSIDGEPVLGVESASLAPRGFTLERPIMVAGQAGTGRTTAVAWMVQAIRASHPDVRLVHLTQRRSSLVDLPWWNDSYVGPQAGEDLLASWGSELEKAADPRTQIVLAIENVQDFGASMSDGPLVQALKGARRAGHLLIGEADTQGWATGQLVAEIKGARRGLLLAPEGADAQMLFAAQAPRLTRADMPPGRGVWIESGRVSVVQMPLDDGSYPQVDRRS
ncbi:FtsK/SpoIIIE domain-containing protein [Demequina sp. NBRC 110052]|uniref:FtsK/SpoIIIE domain-containing protein n=1 Tax=Demequina sp. NBRC 110052 TaxID=1570341 RepID=UPI00117DF6FE|nr:FtsK/SpoIIIE domain-containing protein [Demequina sp. NBRC 110052]